jgi:hypothetical protein
VKTTLLSMIGRPMLVETKTCTVVVPLDTILNVRELSAAVLIVPFSTHQNKSTFGGGVMEAVCRAARGLS